jgi:hypothetical protein
LKRAAFVLLFLASVFTATSAHASVIFTIGNNPQPDEENVFLNTDLTGDPVFGQTALGLQIQFFSTTDLLMEPANGQARIVSVDGLLNNLSVTIPNGSYSDLILNPFLQNNTGGPATITVVALEPNATQQTFTFTYTLGNGSNFVTIVASAGERILSTMIDSTNGFQDLRQPRISGAALNSTPVPEPASIMLLGIGLFGLAARFRRRKQWQNS